MIRGLEVDADEVANTALAPKQLEDGGQDIVDSLVKINLRTDEDLRPTSFSTLLSP